MLDNLGEYDLNFNSIKVRLERTVTSVALTLPTFQFHKGAIRTRISDMVKENPAYFNSIKVRLEPSIRKRWSHFTLISIP